MEKNTAEKNNTEKEIGSHDAFGFTKSESVASFHYTWTVSIKNLDSDAIIGSHFKSFSPHVRLCKLQIRLRFTDLTNHKNDSFLISCFVAFIFAVAMHNVDEIQRFMELLTFHIDFFESMPYQMQFTNCVIAHHFFSLRLSAYK